MTRRSYFPAVLLREIFLRELDVEVGRIAQGEGGDVESKHSPVHQVVPDQRPSAWKASKRKYDIRLLQKKVSFGILSIMLVAQKDILLRNTPYMSIIR